MSGIWASAAVFCATFCAMYFGMNWVERRYGKRTALFVAVTAIVFCAAWLLR